MHSNMSFSLHNLRILDIPCLDLVFGYSPQIFLDEADNSLFLEFCSENSLYVCTYTYYMNRYENSIRLIAIQVSSEMYGNIKDIFPDIKEIGIGCLYGANTITDITYLNSTSSNTEYTHVYGKIYSLYVTDNILTMFDYVIVENEEDIGYYIHLPDSKTYKKLVLLIGGKEKIRYYQYQTKSTNSSTVALTLHEVLNQHHIRGF